MKIQFEILQKTVDELYAKEFDENDTNAINKHCEFIHDVIVAAGWCPDEYLRMIPPRSGKFSN
jgi:hypothetical protein